jgi:inositol phosphorylceramide mannosyltransferase catalytic subunit
MNNNIVFVIDSTTNINLQKLIDNQIKINPDTKFTVVTFDQKENYICINEKLNETKRKIDIENKHNEKCVLYDGVSAILNHLCKFFHKIEQKDILCVIITDRTNIGSFILLQKHLSLQISRNKIRGWKFLYTGNFDKFGKEIGCNICINSDSLTYLPYIESNIEIYDKKLKYIPKNIYQLVEDKTKIHPDFQKNIDFLKEQNPDWNHIIMDDNDMIVYMNKYYPDMISYYDKINPKYGAARADFFRYLLMYREGGVYFDIKSAGRFPLSVILEENDEYILAHFSDNIHKEYLNYPLGEFQQWHIICRPKHPFLKNVIEKVKNNIQNYHIEQDFRNCIGKDGVLKVTGPLAYSKAIIPILHDHPHREAKFDEMIGLVYNNLWFLKASYKGHQYLFSKTHYSFLEESIILN